MAVDFQRFELKRAFNLLVMPISYRKFQRLVGEFHKQCEANMDDQCVISIKLMSAPPFHQARIEADHSEILEMENAANERLVLARASSLSELSSALYRKAKHIEITAMTKSRSEGGRSYNAEFAGGKMTVTNNKKNVEVSVQALNGPISNIL